MKEKDKKRNPPLKNEGQGELGSVEDTFLYCLKDAVALADAPDMYAFFQKVSNYLQGKLWKFLI